MLGIISNSLFCSVILHVSFMPILFCFDFIDLYYILVFPCGSAGIHLQSRRSGFDPLGWEDPLKNRKVTLSSSLAWRIPSTVWSMGSQRVGHDWVTFTFTIFLNQKVWCHQLCFSLSRLLELFGIFSSSIQILEFFCVLFVKNWSFDRDYIEFVYCGGQYEYRKYSSISWTCNIFHLFVSSSVFFNKDCVCVCACFYLKQKD